MELPNWLIMLRRAEIVARVQDDPRTTGDGDLLGVPIDRVDEVIDWGQADFDMPWAHLSTDDRVLLYAYRNQRRHLEELFEAFSQMLGASSIQHPLVIDLGCGPFTGGLALGGVLGPGKTFTYVGMDRASAMHRLGDRLADAALSSGQFAMHDRRWIDRLESLRWTEPPGWRSVIVIVSYLLASPTLNATELVAELDAVLERVGRGDVTILYTNSPRAGPNRSFLAFREALEAKGFQLKVDDIGSVDVAARGRAHSLRYALFFRPRRVTLSIG
jgi:hypothetical protein